MRSPSAPFWALRSSTFGAGRSPFGKSFSPPRAAPGRRGCGSLPRTPVGRVPFQRVRRRATCRRSRGRSGLPAGPPAAETAARPPARRHWDCGRQARRACAGAPDDTALDGHPRQAHRLCGLRHSQYDRRRCQILSPGGSGQQQSYPQVCQQCAHRYPLSSSNFERLMEWSTIAAAPAVASVLPRRDPKVDRSCMINEKSSRQSRAAYGWV